MTKEDLTDLIMRLYFFYETENINFEINANGDLTIKIQSFLKI